MGFISINASKPTIFLGGSKFRLRIPFGKLFVFQTFPMLKNDFVDTIRWENSVFFICQTILFLCHASYSDKAEVFILFSA